MKDDPKLKALIYEYNLIQKKSSNLSRSKRDRIVSTVKTLVEKGIIKIKTL